MTHLKTVFLIITALMMISFPGQNRLHAVESKSTAYDFKLPYLTGKGEFRLSEMLPERDFTVLIFFNSLCESCMFTVEELKDSPAEFKNMDFSAQVVAVNNDTENLNRIRAFVKSAGLTFPVLSDKKNRVASAYGCDGYSFSSFIIDKTGRILDVHYDKRDHMLDYLIQTLMKLPTAK